MINSSAFSFTGPDVRPGDWYCNVGNCRAHNFASRVSCFKCGAFKDELGSNGGGGFNGSGFDGGYMSSVAVGVLDLAVEVVLLVAAAVLIGSLVTGYAPGLAATSTTSPAEWNALDAMRLGIPVAILPFKSSCRVSSSRYYEFSSYIRGRVREIMSY